MLSFLPAPLRGVLTLGLYILDTLAITPALLLTGLMKAAIPWGPWHRFWGRGVVAVSVTWAVILNAILGLTNKIEWDVSLPQDLRLDQSYLVLSNHQSWSDILVLEKVLVGRIPFLRYFLKIQLVWVPILNFAWWALDFPFMRRYSRETLAKKPHLAGKDIEITRRSCRKFQKIPVSIMNFVEGTRFTPAKHQKQGSPYAHLLLPRAGGVALALSAMGPQLAGILDVTIVYQGGAEQFWGFICGRVKKVTVQIKTLPITPELIGDYFNDPEFKQDFQAWLNGLWADKDRRLAALSG
jgi:1-acyl-sn-glycerol-3-phosphate acyltransferase